MKYIKTYENIITDLFHKQKYQIGDYVYIKKPKFSFSIDPQQGVAQILYYHKENKSYTIKFMDIDSRLINIVENLILRKLTSEESEEYRFQADVKKYNL